MDVAPFGEGLLQLRNVGNVRKHATVTGSRNVKLSKPKGATRSDYSTVGLKSAKLTTSNSGKNAKLVLKGSGKASTGSATITGAGTPNDPYPCGSKGKKIKSTYWGGKIKNGSKPLTVHDIFGGISVKSNTDADINKSTVLG